MRVLIQLGMTGVAGVSDYRQLWAAFPEYWSSGRQSAIDDLSAVAEGLRQGGATALTVYEPDRLGQIPVLDSESTPKGIEWRAAADVRSELMSGNPPYDATFQVGWQARCGTSSSFLSHTEGIDLRVAIDSKPVTASHLNAWRAGLPLLGVTGDSALESQLDRALAGTPFLPVKTAASRGTATPDLDAEQSAVAIIAFAKWTAEQAAARLVPALPKRFTVLFSLRADLADQVDGQAGLRRTSPAVVAMSATDWWYEAEPAIEAAVNASLAPLQNASRGVCITDEACLAGQNPDQLGRLRAILTGWAGRDEVEWLT
jgi:D-aminopeptidase